MKVTLSRDDCIQQVVPQRLPSAGETVELKFLISSPRLNGKRADISAFVLDPDMHRYRVNVHLEDGTKQVIAVNPQSISLLDNVNGDHRKDWDIVHVLVPCYVGTKRRCAQFRQCVRSLSRQVGRCRIFVGISGPAQFRQDAMDTLRMAAVSGGGRYHQWIVLDETGSDTENESGDTKMPQFQHLKSLLSVSVDINPNAWLMFLENDAMYHPLRVQFFQENVSNIQDNFQGTRVFCSDGKILVNDAKASTKSGPNAALPLELFLNGDNSLSDIVSTSTNEERGNMQYFDFCVRTDFFNEFLESTPNELLSHQSCNLRFLDALTNITPSPPCFIHPHQNWLYVHYCSRQKRKRGIQQLKFQI